METTTARAHAERLVETLVLAAVEYDGYKITETRKALEAAKEAILTRLAQVETALSEARAETQRLDKLLVSVSAELRHMRLTHQLGPHTVRKVDSLVAQIERATTPTGAAPEGTAR